MDKKLELRIKTQGVQKLDITPGKQAVLSLGDTIPVPELDYDKLYHKPQINNIELQGNKTLEQLNIQETTNPITNLEIETMLQNIFNGGEAI